MNHNRSMLEHAQLKRGQFYSKTDITMSDEVLTGLKTKRQELRPFFIPDVQLLCQRVFKKAIKEVVPLSSGGTFHLLYRVQDCDNKLYVVRLNIPEAQNPSYEFLIDQWIYGVLKAKGLAHLTVYAVDLSRTEFPFDYEIIEYAAGEQLSLLQDPVTQYLPPTLFSSLGQMLAKVHTIPITDFGPIHVGSLVPVKQGKVNVRGVHKSWKDYIFCNLYEHVEFCRSIGTISTQEAERIINLFNHLASFLVIKKGFLLHGDLGNHNIIADGNKITALIDWEDCMSGDPIFDLAYWGTFFRDHYRSQLLEGYCQEKLLPNDFEIRYWLYYLRISLSKTVHRHRFGYLDVPGRPLASARIQKALDNFAGHGL
jgi:aminoglycoside phosphotransferase (APT) family kinase protein